MTNSSKTSNLNNDVEVEVEDEELSLSASGDTSSGTSDKLGTQQSEAQKIKELQEELTKKESATVFKLRVVVIFVLMLAAAAVTGVIYLVTTRGESGEAKSQYEGAAGVVVEAFEDIIENLSSISGLCTTATTDALDSQDEWPFVTLASFFERARNVRFLSKALLIQIAPIVSHDVLGIWDEYIQGNVNSWIEEGLAHQEPNVFEDEVNIEKSIVDTSRDVDILHFFDEDGFAVREQVEASVYAPIWQTSPVLKTGLVNQNLARRGGSMDNITPIIQAGAAGFGDFFGLEPGDIRSTKRETAQIATLRSHVEGHEVSHSGSPISNLVIPIFNSLNETSRRPVAVMTAMIHWRGYFRNILPENIRGVYVVLENTCSDPFTLQIHGKEVEALGAGDLHDTRFEGTWERTGALGGVALNDGTENGILLHQDGCQYSIRVYPSQTFFDAHHTNTPIIITVSIIGVFLFTIFMFLLYDRLVERRQAVILAKATRSSAIVSSLFPKNVRDRLLDHSGYTIGNSDVTIGSKSRLKGFLGGQSQNEDQAAPIADLFPECTVFFGDIAGFTAWSSTRDPAQVFTLLQTLYHAFDALATRRKVFKVETIGDCYMAVTGLPEPQNDHAQRMVRFANDAVTKMRQLVRDLESSLGPDTGILALRCGIHSGPVTAGVLRGDRARFQLFGDTVNTASRMESTSVPGMIQASTQTAEYLVAAGKEKWLSPRKDAIQAKGKGQLATFWVSTKDRNDTPSSSGSLSVNSILRSSCTSNETSGNAAKQNALNKRLIDWMTDLLLDNIRKVVHARGQKEGGDADMAFQLSPGKTCLAEVKEIIEMPSFDPASVSNMSDGHRSVVVEADVVESLREYVAAIADMYRENPFHNFEHACHVTLSTNKLLGRIVAPDLTVKEESTVGEIACQLHSQTYGLASDALAGTAILFSALIHDVDHRGVSNAQLSSEDPELAKAFSNKSIAEQNSVHIAWATLMEDKYRGLRQVLFGTEADLKHFRQILVNMVLATDIFDQELSALRKARWEAAFSDEPQANPNHPAAALSKKKNKEQLERKCTIVLEHIIQASDVSHTMQHWHVYQKWNKSLFLELCAAYKSGRLANDPATFWYKGELGFFDNYVIPLAKKLKECGVFGVSSDEYLNYAIQNRAEWEKRGEEIVKSFADDAALLLASSGSSMPELQSCSQGKIRVEE